MLRSIKNFILKKKNLKLIVFLIGSFFFLSNVNASGYDVTLDYSSSKLQLLEDNYEIIENLIDIANQYNTHNFGYIIYFGYMNSNSRYIYIGVNQHVMNNNSYFNQITYLRNTSNTWTFRNDSIVPVNYGSCYFGETNCANRYYLLLDNYSQTDLTNFYNNAKSLFTNSFTNTSITPSWESTFPSNNNLSPYVDTNTFIVYVYSNYDIHYKIGPSVNGVNYINNLIVDNETIEETDIIPLYNTYRENLVHDPEISFTSQTYSSNNLIYKNDVTIDFGYIDNDNYYYMYLDTNENIWHSLYLTNDSSYTLSLYDNTNIIAQVIDKSTNEVFINATYLVNNIDNIMDIKILVGQNYNTFGVVTSIPIEIYYYTNDRSQYIYDYYSSIWGDNAYWLQLNDDVSSISFTEYYDTLITARIKDLQGNVLYTKTYNIENVVRVPEVNFISSPIWTYETFSGPVGQQLGRNCIYENDIYIDFGYLDNTKYIYQYSPDLGETWYTLDLSYNCQVENSSCVGYSVPMHINGHVIARVLSKIDNHVVSQATYTINNIGICNAPGDSTGTFEVNRAFNFWVSPIRNFLSIISYFWNGLPVTLKYFFEILFILLVMLFALRFLL